MAQLERLNSVDTNLDTNSDTNEFNTELSGLKESIKTESETDTNKSEQMSQDKMEVKRVVGWVVLTNIKDSAEMMNFLKSLDKTNKNNMTYLQIYWGEGKMIEGLDLKWFNNLSKLRLKNVKIDDKTLKNCQNLNKLQINNSIGDLDLSHNKQLTNIFFENMPSLTNIDLSNNTNLKVLILDWVNITKLDLINNKNLTDLTLQNCPIEELDLSSLIKLKSVRINYYPANTILKKINISNITELRHVSIKSCLSITELDFTTNKALEVLSIQKTNNLKVVDLSKHLMLTDVYADSVMIDKIKIPEWRKLEKNKDFSTHYEVIK